MRYYADLQVQNNCFVELRYDRTPHFYSVPYIHVGKKARVIFTRSTVNVFVEGILVATHARSHQYGHTYLKEHLTSNCRAIMERSASYYISWAQHISEDCREYTTEVFNPKRTSQPEEVYYKLCAAIISLSRKYEVALINRTCRLCLECKVFSYKRFEAILKHNSLQKSDDL